MPKPRPLALAAVVMLSACGGPPVTVSFEGIDNGVARFLVRNSSPDDVRAAQFSVTFSAAPGDPLQVDTVRYEMAGAADAEAPFVRAGDETFFVHATGGSVTATAKVLAVEFSNGKTWPVP